MVDPVIVIGTCVVGCIAWLIWFFIPTTQQKPHTKQDNSKAEKPKQLRVYVDGCWDLCHSGHYNAIRQAKSLGSYLVAGVHSSEEIARNKRWPIMSDSERMACVQACKWVDKVVFDVPYSPTIELIDRKDILCDVVAHGDDLSMAANGECAYQEVINANRFKIFKRTPGVSTTSLIDRLITAVGDTSPISNNNNSIGGNHHHNNNDINNNDTESDETKTSEAVSSIASWSQFLATSQRIGSFSNHKTPNKNDKVIYIDGIFDLFHAGHVAALKDVKKEGTFLYVGIFDDLLVKTKILDQNGNSKKHFPLMNLQERVLNVLSCKYVDEVIIGCPYNMSNDMIRVLNINTIVTSNITNDELLINNNNKRFNQEMLEKFASNHVRVKHIIAKDSQLTTSKLMKRIVKDQERMKKENENRVAKEKKYLESRQYVQES